MFSSSAPILHRSSTEGRGRCRIGRRLNDGHTSPCLDENLKCSVNCCIVHLSTTNTTAMTEQDKITIFDALIKPFLCSDALSIDHEGDNLFAQAIRQLLNSSLLAQQDNHLGCERPILWKALTDSLNAEQTLSRSSPQKLLFSEL